MTCPFCHADGAAPGGCPACGRPMMLTSRYELREQLGEGGFGVVYRAYDSTREQDVALKTLRREHARAEVIKRFRRESEQARRVAHPNVCRMYEDGRDGDVHFITMELVDGVSLKEVLKRDGSFPLAAGLAVAVQIADALAAIHEKDIVHRDLKPANVMRTAKGRVMVTDFGIVKPLTPGTPELTEGAALIGSPAYMSPEQIEGAGAIDARSDIYCFGVLLYELFTGRVPFVGNTDQVLRDHLRTIPTLDGLPPRLVPVVARALAKSPAERYGSATEMRAILDALRTEAGAAEPTRPITPVPGVLARDVAARILGVRPDAPADTILLVYQQLAGAARRNIDASPTPELRQAHHTQLRELQRAAGALGTGVRIEDLPVVAPVIADDFGDPPLPVRVAPPPAPSNGRRERGPLFYAGTIWLGLAAFTGVYYSLIRPTTPPPGPGGGPVQLTTPPTTVPPAGSPSPSPSPSPPPAPPPAPPPITRIFSSGGQVSGFGAGWSDWYRLCSDPAPPGYQVGPVEFRLSGDRSCGGWADCRQSMLNETQVCWEFRLQGHNEFPPRTGISTGQLTVTFTPR